MKSTLEQIEEVNGMQFLIDLKNAYRVQIYAPETRLNFEVTKKEVRFWANTHKIDYTISDVFGNLIMTIQ